jgi:Chaperone of endosialidase
MTSQIDPTVPVQGTPTTASVRSNFQIAKDEISALQVATNGAPFLPLAGGSLAGAVYVDRDPTDPRQIATKAYVDVHGGGSGGGGIPEAPADGTTYGRNNGAWIGVTTPADVTAAINAAIVPATETVRGTALIATTAQVNAGTDDAAFVTSLKLQTKLNAATSGVFIPINGSTVVRGNLSFAPTAASATASLILNRPDAAGLAAIYAQQAGSALWQMTLADTNNNFILNRAIGPSAGNVLTIEQQSGAFRFNPLPGTGVGGLSIMSDNQNAGPTIIAGALTALSNTQDYLLIAARRIAAPVNGSMRDGAMIVLRGPSSTTNANGIELAAGSNAAGYQTATLAASGLLSVPGGVNAGFNGAGGVIIGTNGIQTQGGYTQTGSGGNVFSGGITGPSLVLNGGGTAVLNVTNGGITVAGGIYCAGINTNNGGIAAGSGPISGGTLTGTSASIGSFSIGGGMTQTGPGGITFSGGLTANGSIITTTIGATSAQLNGGGNAVLNVPNGGIAVAGTSTFAQTIEVDGGGNAVVHCPNGGITASGLTADQINCNANAYKPGGGPWSDSSDARLKTAVQSYTTGLDAVCDLRPISFEFNGLAGTKPGVRHFGLVADEAVLVMPELVGSKRAKLRPDDDEETDILTLDATALTYALVNALREVRNRLAQLEEAHART